jgi:hypothetical protein
MASSFVKPWTNLWNVGEQEGPLVPTLKVMFVTEDDRLRLGVFLIDSGADLTMASRDVCDELGLDWNLGQPTKLSGISNKPECDVSARIFDVNVRIPELETVLTIPICFTEGDSSLLLGREGFFDAFRVTFDKRNQQTVFEVNSSQDEK